MDLDSLQLEVGGETRTFRQWTWDFVNTYYPNIGRRHYRVPALHFNQQTLNHVVPTAGSPPQLLLYNDPSLAVGDLAHTVVVERLEELSHRLQHTGQGPLFIISSLTYDNYLAKLYSQEQKRKGKQQLPPRPSEERGQQGEIDILLLHRTAGVVMIEVKAVGHSSSNSSRSSSSSSSDSSSKDSSSSSNSSSSNSSSNSSSSSSSSGSEWTPTEQELQQTVQRRVRRAEQQLLRAKDTLHYVMPDVHFPNVTLVLALPYVTRDFLMKAVSAVSVDGNLQFLCKDDLWPSPSSSPSPCVIASTPPHRVSSSSNAERQGDRDERQGDSGERQRDSGERQGDRAERQGDSAERQGDSAAERQGDSAAERQGNRAERQGDSAERQGDSAAERQGNRAERQGNRAERQGDSGAERQEDSAERQGDSGAERQGVSGAERQGVNCRAEGQEMSGLLAWWGNTVCVDHSTQFSLDSMKTVVGRICGLLSVVSVWTTGRPRMEVRTPGQAIGESGRRLADIVLLPKQAELLAQPGLHRLWLMGPMGSGKTLLLQLKGRQWLNEGRRVIVINVRTASRGRPQGHVLERSIRRDTEGESMMGSVERHDVALDEFQFDSLQKELEAEGPTEKACFLVDEVLSEMSSIAQSLAEHFPHCPIWCVASYLAPVPPTFNISTLHTVIRNPPSVQLMLKEIDLNPQHQSAYTTRSAARGLACDGPPIIFIEHFKHNTHVRHLDCSQCAHELADIFEHQLGLKLLPPAQDQNHQQTTLLADPFSTSSSNPSPKKLPKTVEASPVTFRDVLILGVLSMSSFRHVSGYHWDASIPDVLQFIMYMGSSHFVSTLRQRGVPLRLAVDNTQKEIAYPPNDEVIICDIMGVHSLERKVVVLFRTGPPLTQEEVSEHVSRYQTVQAAAKTADSAELRNLQELMKTSLDEQTISKQLHFFASLLYEVRDIIYPQIPTHPSMSTEEATAIFHRLLGNMLVAGTQSFTKVSKGDLQPSHLSPLKPPSATVPRRGMEYRCYTALSPDSDPDPDPDHDLKGDSESSSAQTEDGPSQEKTEADCRFFVPDRQEDLEQRQSEVRRIQKALEGLSDDDLDWEFFAASRCLSQYISVLS